MKVAIIGIGLWGQVLLKELKEVVEVKYECDKGSDLDKVFSDPEVEAVFIATPTATHLNLAKRSLEAGKHVFLEKPATSSSQDLESLVGLAEERGLRFAVGYEFVHDPAIKKIKELIKGQKIERLLFEWCKWGSFLDDPVPHLLSHEVSIAKYLGVDITPISCRKIGVISDCDIVITEFDKATSFINRVSDVKEKRITVLTENGGYVSNNGKLYLIDKNNHSLSAIDVEGPSSVKAEISDFFLSIENNREPYVNGRFALSVYQTIEQV